MDLLVAPRRYVLDTLVAEAAARAGVDVRTGVTVTGVCHDTGPAGSSASPDTVAPGHRSGSRLGTSSARTG